MVHKWRGSKRGFSASFIAAATAAVMCLAGSSDCEASTGRLDDGLNSPLSFGAGGRKDCLCAVSEHTRGSRVGSRPSTRETRIWMRTGLLGEGLRGGGPGLMPDPSWSDEIEEEGLIKVRGNTRFTPRPAQRRSRHLKVGKGPSLSLVTLACYTCRLML